jgi:hypothetical protein
MGGEIGVSASVPTRVGSIIGAKVAVGKSKADAVGTPANPSGVCVAEGRDTGGFRQIKKNAPIRRHKPNMPQPRPPIRKTSNTGRYFLKESINLTNLLPIRAYFF